MDARVGSENGAVSGRRGQCRPRTGILAQRQFEQHAPRLARVGDRRAPRIASGASAVRARFAEVDHQVREARAAQQVGHPVGHEALRDAVQRDRHAGAPQPDEVGAKLDAGKPHVAQRVCNRCRRRAGGGRAGPREVRGVEPIERLHRRIEGAAARSRQVEALRQQLDQFERRVAQFAGRVQPRQRRIGTVQAEHRLEPVDLADAALHERLRLLAFGVDQRHRRQRTHRGPPPDDGLGGRAGARAGKRRGRRAGGNDRQEASAIAHGCSPQCFSGAGAPACCSGKPNR